MIMLGQVWREMHQSVRMNPELSNPDRFVKIQHLRRCAVRQCHANKASVKHCTFASRIVRKSTEDLDQFRNLLSSLLSSKLDVVGDQNLQTICHPRPRRRWTTSSKQELDQAVFIVMKHPECDMSPHDTLLHSMCCSESLQIQVFTVIHALQDKVHPLSSMRIKHRRQDDCRPTRLTRIECILSSRVIVVPHPIESIWWVLPHSSHRNQSRTSP